MANYEGIAVMYLSMPMCAQPLPIMGTCSVQEKKISLKFPLTNVSFDIPAAPQEGAHDLEFKMAGAKGDMTLKIQYKPDIRGFIGRGMQDDGTNVMTFAFGREGQGFQHFKLL